MLDEPITSRFGARQDVEADFRAFLIRREAASLAYVRGDPEPLDAMVVREGDATFFPPRGGTVEGAATVATRYAGDAGHFGAGSTESRFEILALAADGELAYWSGLQHAKVELQDRERLVPMTLRVTEIFRREDGEWRLVHRHADAGVQAAGAADRRGG